MKLNIIVIIIHIASAKNVTDLKNYIEDAVATRKEENDMIGKLQQSLLCGRLCDQDSDV